MHEKPFDAMDEFAVEYAIKLSKNMMSRWRIIADHYEEEDIQNELLATYFEKKSNFKKSDATMVAFVKRIMISRLKDEYRKLNATKRSIKTNMVSLEENPRALDLLMDTGEFWRGYSADSFSDMNIKEIDIQRMKKILFEDDVQDLQELFLLLETKSITEIANELKISREAIRPRVKKLKNYLIRKGVADEYYHDD